MADKFTTDDGRSIIRDLNTRERVLENVAVTIPPFPGVAWGISKRDVNPGASWTNGIYAGQIHDDGYIWACSFGGLAKSLDGVTWTNVITSFYTPSVPENAGKKLSDYALAPEGMFIHSDGSLFLSSPSSNDAEQYSRIVWNPAATASANTWKTVKAVDGTTPFLWPKAGQVSGKGGHFNQWSIWQIQYAHELDPSGILSLGDVVVGQYHRRDDADAIRAGFIFVMRKVDTEWVINADATTMEPTSIDGIMDDPFKTWNDYYARIVKHVHHVLVGADGTYYVSTGDTVPAQTITSCAGTVGGEVTVTAAAHGLPVGCYVLVAGVTTMTGINSKEFRIKSVTADTFVLEGSVANAATGTGGTVTPRIFQGDSGKNYRVWAIQPGENCTVRQIRGAGYGYTAMLLDDDGTIIMGNDAEPMALGSMGTIDRYNPVTGEWTNMYTPPYKGMDFPIWDIVKTAKGEYLAVVQKPGNTAYAGYSRAALLRCTDGVTFHPIAVSGFDSTDLNYMDFDRILATRRNRIPGTHLRAVVTQQPGKQYVFTVEV